MSEQQQGAAPAMAQAVAGRIFDDAVRHDLKPNGRCWVACDMNIASALIAAYADARVAEAVAPLRKALVEIAQQEWAGIAGAGPAAARAKTLALEVLAALAGPPPAATGAEG